MSLAERFNAGRFAVSLEITPPQDPRPSVLMRRATLLGPCADAVNVIQRPGRQSSLDASIALKDAGLSPVWHIVTRGGTRKALADELTQARTAGISQVLLIRGDHAGEDTPDTPTIREATAMAAETLPGACIGATLNQYVPDRAAVLKNLLPKLSAGATWVQTQPVFDPEALRPLAEAARERAPATRVIAMVVPLLTPAAVEGIQRRLGFALPDDTLARLAPGTPEAGWAVFEDTVAAVAACGFVDGVAVMTTEMDPPPGAGDRIRTALHAAGIDCGIALAS